jgi:hypothetical protein
MARLFGSPQARYAGLLTFHAFIGAHHFGAALGSGTKWRAAGQMREPEL